jgi:hypothetical protein
MNTFRNVLPGASFDNWLFDINHRDMAIEGGFHVLEARTSWSQRTPGSLGQRQSLTLNRKGRLGPHKQLQQEDR